MSQPKYTPLDEHENEGNLFSTNVSDFDSPMKHGHHSFFKTKTFKILLVVAAILTLVLVAAIIFILTKTSSSGSHMYNLSPSWSADFQTAFEFVPGMNLSGHIWMDFAVNHRFRIDVLTFASVIFDIPTLYTVKKFPDCTYNETIYPINETEVNTIQLNFTYQNTYSTYTNDKGKSADCTLFQSQKFEGASITVCLANDETLAFARFNIPQTNGSYLINFKNFQAWNATEDKSYDSIFTVPEDCALEFNSTYPGNEPRRASEKRSFESFDSIESFVKPILSSFQL